MNAWILTIGCLTACLALPAFAHAAEAPVTRYYTAAQLAQARKTRLPDAPTGTVHAWAWQRVGTKVTWTLGGKKLPPAIAGTDTKKSKPGTFAWVALGQVKLPAGTPVKVAFTPASAKPESAAVAALALSTSADARPADVWAMTRVFPAQPKACDDKRPTQCRHINMRYTMPAYPTKADWERRAAWLREHIRVSSGLLPEPVRCDLKPKIFGKIERDGYTIEKVYFQAYPGFYVTGNLYRPRGGKGPYPGIASPHGHWTNGRFGHQPPRGSVFARCITLARLGYVIFAYDMVGYNDSGKQIPKHRGLFQTPRELQWGVSLMHLQSWDTIRVLDFLETLPDVDPKRLAVTGCSGGGTQTFMVMGIEPRVAVAAPVCMISGIMQGGCQCENAPLLRIETNNIEIGALMAPRPMVMPSASGDWTKETPKVEYPSIRSIYKLYGAADRVVNIHSLSPHGYNREHREGVYNFFRRWLQGVKQAPTTPPSDAWTYARNAPKKTKKSPAKPPAKAPAKPDAKDVVHDPAEQASAPFPPPTTTWISEPPYQQEKREDLLVWQGRQLPKGAKTPETLSAFLIAQARKQRDEFLPTKPEDMKRFRETLGVVYQHSMRAEYPNPADVEAKHDPAPSRTRNPIPTAHRLRLSRKGKGDSIPAIFYRGLGMGLPSRRIVLVHAKGKAALCNPTTGQPGPALDAMLSLGGEVLAIDPYLTGEFHSPFAETKPKTERCYDTYNRTAVVQRVQDILTAAAYMRSRGGIRPGDPGPPVCVVGTGQAGAWCLLAAPLLPKDVSVACDLTGLAGDGDKRWETDLYCPMLLKAGAPWTPAALAAPRRLLLHGLSGKLNVKPFRAAYRAAGAAGKLRTEKKLLAPHVVSLWLRGITLPTK